MPDSDGSGANHLARYRLAVVAQAGCSIVAVARQGVVGAGTAAGCNIAVEGVAVAQVDDTAVDYSVAVEKVAVAQQVDYNAAAAVAARQADYYNDFAAAEVVGYKME